MPLTNELASLFQLIFHLKYRFALICIEIVSCWILPASESVGSRARIPAGEQHQLRQRFCTLWELTSFIRPHNLIIPTIHYVRVSHNKSYNTMEFTRFNLSRSECIKIIVSGWGSAPDPTPVNYKRIIFFQQFIFNDLRSFWNFSKND